VNNSFDLISEDFDDEVEELDLTEEAMYERTFKKFYYRKLKPKQLIEEDNDCLDIEDEEINEDELEITDEDIEIEEEDLK